MSGRRGWRPVGPNDGLPAPAGGYSPAAIAGGLIFVAGQVPKDPVTGAMVGADVRAQTRQVLANTERVLHAAGASLENIVSVTAYLASMDDWKAFDETYRELLPEPLPARTTVGAELRGFLVELSVIAVLPGA